MAKEREGAVTMRGNPVTLVGDEIKVGDTAPDFELVGQDMSPVKFSDYAGKWSLSAPFHRLTRQCATRRHGAGTKNVRLSVMSRC